MGKACEPVFEPLGLNWKAAIALVSGVAAKEIVVSTIGVLYAGDETAADGSDSETPSSEPLSERLAASGDFTPASALAFLVFILIYFPCIATVSAIASEAGWRWATLSIVYNTLLAWIVSFVVYHLANCF